VQALFPFFFLECLGFGDKAFQLLDKEEDMCFKSKVLLVETDHVLNGELILQ
jgi:hypothetical protein